MSACIKEGVKKNELRAPLTRGPHPSLTYLNGLKKYKTRNKKTIITCVLRAPGLSIVMGIEHQSSKTFQIFFFKAIGNFFLKMDLSVIVIIIIRLKMT